MSKLNEQIHEQSQELGQEQDQKYLAKTNTK